MTVKYLSTLAAGLGLALGVAMPVNALTSNFTTGAISDAPSSTVFATTQFTTVSSDGIPTSLSLDLNHDDLSDLEIYLTAPDGKVLSIATLLGGSGQITPTLSDTGISSIDNGAFPYNDIFRPDQSGFAFTFTPTPNLITFSGFGFQNAGTYTLSISDISPINTGVLNSASLNVQPVPFEFSPVAGVTVLGAWSLYKKSRKKAVVN